MPLYPSIVLESGASPNFLQLYIVEPSNGFNSGLGSASLELQQIIMNLIPSKDKMCLEQNNQLKIQ
jgi:hypothetical protein